MNFPIWILARSHVWFTVFVVIASTSGCACQNCRRDLLAQLAAKTPGDDVKVRRAVAVLFDDPKLRTSLTSLEARLGNDRSFRIVVYQGIVGLPGFTNWDGWDTLPASVDVSESRYFLVMYQSSGEVGIITNADLSLLEKGPIGHSRVVSWVWKKGKNSLGDHSAQFVTQAPEYLANRSFDGSKIVRISLITPTSSRVIIAMNPELPDGYSNSVPVPVPLSFDVQSFLALDH